MKSMKYALLFLLALALPLVAVRKSEAALTPAGTSIGNTATLTYAVGSVTQPTVSGSSTPFLVDRKVNYDVTYVPAAYVPVMPGSTDQALTYKVTNTGNSVQDFHLAVADFAGGVIAGTGLGGTDNQNATNVRIFTSSSATLDGSAVQGSYLDEIPQDGSYYVYIVGNFPTSTVPALANGQLIGEALTVTPMVGGTAGSEGAAPVQNVVDAGGIYTVLAVSTASINGAYKITAPVLAIFKTATTIWDPVNGSSTPRNIPGAAVRYKISITNGGAVPALLTTITDTLSSTNLSGGLISLTSLATPVTYESAGNSLKLTDAARGIAGTYFAQGAGITKAGSPELLTVDYATLLPAGGGYAAGELKNGETVDIEFDVFIQ